MSFAGIVRATRTSLQKLLECWYHEHSITSTVLDCFHLKSPRSLIACLALMALPSLNAGTAEAPAIASATVDYAANRVTLTGSNFSPAGVPPRSEEHTSELQSPCNLV